MRIWIRTVFALALIALLLWMAGVIGKVTLDVFSIRSSGGTVERDPQFAEEPERVTMPPELWQTGGESQFKDNSANWNMPESAPVDQTAEELENEARGGA
jgi:hypothetical protein